MDYPRSMGHNRGLPDVPPFFRMRCGGQEYRLWDSGQPLLRAWWRVAFLEGEIPRNSLLRPIKANYAR
ncbi:MAG: hypothetical protein HG464_002570 [Bacteroidia bacterium]|nr:hypothetical protein [Bacteroidia bacterium]